MILRFIVVVLLAIAIAAAAVVVCGENIRRRYAHLLSCHKKASEFIEKTVFLANSLPYKYFLSPPFVYNVRGISLVQMGLNLNSTVMLRWVHILSI